MLRVASGLVVVAAVAVVVALAAAATGPNKVVSFRDLPRGWGPGIPRDVRSGSRIVGRLDGHTIAAAPTRNGNYCEAFWVEGGNGGSGGCRVRGAFPDHRTGDFHAYLVGGGFRANRTGIISIQGSTAAGPRPRLFVVYADGSRELLPVIWVSTPIRAGFFYRTIPRGHLSKARRANSLELREGARLIARQQIPLPPRLP